MPHNATRRPCMRGAYGAFVTNALKVVTDPRAKVEKAGGANAVLLKK